jgi:prophage regulatory protein
MRIINAKERRRRIPYWDMHIWRLERQGKFPQRVKLDPTNPRSSVGWVEEEIDQWLAARAAARNHPA